MLDLVEEYRLKLIEGAAEEDPELLEKYIENPLSISPEDIRKQLRKATLESRAFPVFCGSSFKNKGVQLLLDGVVHYLPSPCEMEEIEGVNPKAEAKESRDNSTKVRLCFGFQNSKRSLCWSFSIYTGLFRFTRLWFYGV